MSTEITVRGAFSAFRPAERGTVHTTVAYEGPEMEAVSAPARYAMPSPAHSNTPTRWT